MNQLEVWFGILARKVIRRGNFTSQADLRTRIMDFIDYCNATLAPCHFLARLRLETSCPNNFIQGCAGSSGAPGPDLCLTAGVLTEAHMQAPAVDGRKIAH